MAQDQGAIQSTPEPVVQVSALVKNYGALRAVRGVSFEIFPGEIFGLIGPDGAGKTATFHILGGVLEATSGAVAVLGMSPRDARSVTGYLTQKFSLYLDLSVDENLRYVAGLHRVSAADFAERRRRYLGIMNLERFSNRLASQLSGGMKQKLALCCALISRPRVLLLDEPTTGVDPVSRREFWDILATIVTEGVTVAVATPYLDEAERCSRLIMMHEGEIQEIGTPAELKRSLGWRRLEVRGDNLTALERALEKAQAVPGAVICDVQPYGDRLDVLVSAEQQGSELVRQSTAGAIAVSAQDPTLENVFVSRLKAKTPARTNVSFPFGNGGAARHQGMAIAARGISKMFGAFRAVHDVHLAVEYGEVYGLLGANGAGKTTTIKMLCGLIAPSGGAMELCGEKGSLRGEALRQRLGYMSQKFTLYDDLTIIENLEFYCGVYCVPDRLKAERIRWVLESSGLAGQEKLLSGNLPGGWRQRLAFGAAALHQPEVLFLDEPTSGVDPLARRDMWKSIREFARQGTAVLVTTHFMEEAEHCHKLGFMVDGELVVEGSPSAIKASQPGQVVELRYAVPQEAYILLRKNIEPWRVSIFGASVHVVVDDPAKDVPRLRAITDRSGLETLGARHLPFSLEDVFIAVVQGARSKAA